MIRRRFICALLSACMLLLAGCDGREIDPGYNLTGGLRVFPDTSVQEELATSVLPEEDADTSKDEATNDNPGVIVINPEAYPAIPKSIIASSSYSQYLESVVNLPVQEVLQERGNSNLFYCAVFYGYEPDGDGGMSAAPSTFYRESTGHNVAQTSTYLCGVSLPKFAKQYLADVGNNATVMTKAYRDWNAVLDQCGVSKTATWMAAKADAVFSAKYRTVVNMWGNTRLSGAGGVAGTFKDFVSAANRADIIGVVPDVSIQIQDGYRTFSSITLNPTAGLNTGAYYDRLSVGDVKKLLTSYNQQRDRTRNHLTVNTSDDYSIVHAEIDGYNRCIVVISCLPGTTLEKELGKAGLSKVKESILKYSSWDSVDAVRDVIADAVIITRGTRGVN